MTTASSARPPSTDRNSDRSSDPIAIAQRLPTRWPSESHGMGWDGMGWEFFLTLVCHDRFPRIAPLAGARR
jgi:hypothetical protein